MRIQEVFYSLQGEGLHTGTPSIFIRLTGCPLRCRWCDTAYAWNYDGGSSYEVEEIIRASRQWVSRHIVITGGEPLLDRDGRERGELRHLIAALKKDEHYVTIETAGPVFVENLHGDLMSISPKLTNAHKMKDMSCTKHAGMITKASVIRQFIKAYPYQLKFVIDSRDDMQEIVSFLDEVGDYDRGRVMLMPQARSRRELLERAPLVAELCQETGLRFCQRLQILLWDGQRGR